MSHPMLSLAPDEMPGRDAYRLMHSVIVPRPIGWISTISREGIPNLAPYSFFNGVGNPPPIVMVAIGKREGRRKDTMRNAQEVGQFVVNLADEHLAEAMNATATDWPHGVDEFERAGLKAAPCENVKPPRVADAPVAMEALVTQIIPVEGATTELLLGQIVRYHIRKDLLRPNGLVDASRMKIIMRLGGDEYATLGEIFRMTRSSVSAQMSSSEGLPADE